MNTPGECFCYQSSFAPNVNTRQLPLIVTLSPSLDTKEVLLQHVNPDRGLRLSKPNMATNNETMSRTTPQLIPLNLTHRLTRTKGEREEIRQGIMEAR